MMLIVNFSPCVALLKRLIPGGSYGLWYGKYNKMEVSLSNTKKPQAESAVADFLRLLVDLL